MKRTKILYWAFTGVFAAFMFVFALPDILSSEIAIEGFTKMGMPFYLLIVYSQLLQLVKWPVASIIHT